jgi:hypothetical protein
MAHKVQLFRIHRNNILFICPYWGLNSKIFEFFRQAPTPKVLLQVSNKKNKVSIKMGK